MKSRFTTNKDGKNQPQTDGQPIAPRRTSTLRAFSLIELCLAVFIMAIVFTGIIQGNMQAARRAEWSGYSLAAGALANQQIEQCRSAIWDNGAWPPVNQLATLNLLNWTTNTPPANGSSYTVGSGYSWADLDLPRMGTNRVRATNWVTIRMVNLNNSTNPPVRVQMIQVETAWPFNQFSSSTRYFTNRLVTYIAPDDRSPGSF